MRSSYNGRTKILPHGFDYSPVALWQLNGNLRDSGPNKFTLTLETSGTGGERYANIGGLQGFYFDGATNLLAGLDSRLQTNGDVTVEFIAHVVPFTLGCLVGTGTAGSDTEPNNDQYTIYANNAAAIGITSFWEHDAGVDVSTQTQYSPNGMCHIAMVKSLGGTAVQFFANGLPASPIVTGLTASTGGTTSQVRIGSDHSGNTSAFRLSGFMSSVKIVLSALSAAQVKDEYNRTLGPVYGLRS